MKGFLVIDNSAYGVPAGGIRYAQNITLSEMTRLARAMSLKFCTYGFPTGGAKSGLIGNPFDNNRDLLITSFALSIAPFIKEKIYYPGPDMGTYDSDLERIFKIAGTPELVPRKIGLMKNDIPIEELFTGYGVVNCLKTVLQYKKTKINKPKIILEGFGKVGTSIALYLRELNYKLTGVSTIKGAIYDEDGLNIDQLLRLKNEFGGDELINHYESKNVIKILKEKLFELSSDYPTDVIIPGARPDVINKDNVDKIKAKGIIPAANIPYQKGVIDILEEKGIVCFPDFVSNAGEILAIAVINNPISEAEIFNYIKTKIVEKTLEILNGANEKKKPPFHFAETEALNALKKKMTKIIRKIERINKKF